MKFTDFLIVLCGVLLNAVAQLLLKAGVNSVGRIAGARSTARGPGRRWR